MRLENQTIELTVQSALPMTLKAHYDIDLTWARGEDGDMDWSYSVALGYVEVSVAGKAIAELEGKEIPFEMQALVLSAIPELTDEEARDAASDYEDQERFYRQHAAGRI